MGLGGLEADLVGDADEQSLALREHGSVVQPYLAAGLEGAVAAPAQAGPTREVLAHRRGVAVADLEAPGHGPGACEEGGAAHGLVEDGAEQTSMHDAG